MLEALNKSEIDMQIATAHAYPRNEEKALDKMAQLACMDVDTASDCFYNLERKKADGTVEEINGLSVRMAEIIAACWGNLRVQARIIGNDGQWITAQGICHDLESNVAVSKEVKRRITYKNGMTYSEDLQVLTGNAACAIAYRNAVLAVVPKVRQQTCEWWAKKGVTVEQLVGYLGVANADGVGKEELFKLRALAQAIHEGTTTIAEVFVQPVQQAAQVEAVKKAAQEAKEKAELAMATARTKKATGAK